MHLIRFCFRILGIPALITAAETNPDELPTNTRPVYNFSMKGVYTAFSGIRKREELVSWSTCCSIKDIDDVILFPFRLISWNSFTTWADQSAKKWTTKQRTSSAQMLTARSIAMRWHSDWMSSDLRGWPMHGIIAISQTSPRETKLLRRNIVWRFSRDVELLSLVFLKLKSRIWLICCDRTTELNARVTMRIALIRWELIDFDVWDKQEGFSVFNFNLRGIVLSVLSIY